MSGIMILRDRIAGLDEWENMAFYSQDDYDRWRESQFDEKGTGYMQECDLGLRGVGMYDAMIDIPSIQMYLSMAYDIEDLDLTGNLDAFRP